MHATYLTGKRVALRAALLSDKDHAVAWFEGEFPVNSDRAEKHLRDELNDLTARKALLMIVSIDHDEIVGGARLRLRQRYSNVAIQMAPGNEDSDELRGETLKLLVPWLRDEGEHITVTLDIAADQQLTIAAAEAAGMEQTARIREWYHRPGGRVDRLIYQAIHPDWKQIEPSHA